MRSISFIFLHGLAMEPVVLAGPAGKFDFMAHDPVGNRVLAAHTATHSREVVDLATGKALPAVAVGDAQGLAVDPEHHRYFVGNKDDKSVAVVDSL